MTFKIGIRVRSPYLTMVKSQNTEETAILRFSSLSELPLHESLPS